MDPFIAVWRWWVLVSVVVFPQLLGILLYFRLRWAPRWLAAIAAALAPALIFFWLAPIYLFAGLHEHYNDGVAQCGMPIMGAVLLLLFGTTVQLVLGLITQMAFAARRLRKNAVS
jgi:hypothetical protein